MIKSYNAMLQEVVAELQKETATSTVQFVDINAAVDKNTQLYDGVHPSKEGYGEIANAFYNAIISHYTGVTPGTGTTVLAPTDVTGVPSDFYAKDGSINSDYQFVQDITLDVTNNWQKTFSDLDEAYAYYVVEPEISGWESSIAHNGQPVNGETATITVTNTKTIEKTSISVEKKWVDNDKAGASHGAVNVTLRRKLKSGTDYDKGFSETAELSSANGWTHTWSSLDKTDVGGNQYLYDVVEENVPGYQATYKNNNGVNGNTAENPIVIVNTKVLQLTLKKRWSDSDTNNHQNDPVEVKIYRSTNPADVPVVTTATTKATTTMTTKATTTKATATETTTKATTTTTTTTTSAKETKPEETTTTTVETGALITVVTGLHAGDTLKVKLSNSTATSANAKGCFGYSYEPADNGWAKDEWKGSFDANGKMELTYPVPDQYQDGAYFEFQVWEVDGTLPKALTIDSIEIVPKVTTTTTTTTKPEETTTTTTTTPPPSGGDTVTGSSIVLEKDAHSVNLDSTKTVSKLELNISLTSTTNQWYNVFYFEFKKANQTIGGSVGFTWNFSNSSISEVSWNNGGGTCTINGASLTYVFTTPISTDKLEIVNGSKDNSIWMIDSYTITYATDTSAQSLAAPSAMRMLRMAANVMTSGSAGVELVDTVTLKGSDSSSWQAVRTNLPACDENGNPYYYWAEETAVGGYTPSYTYAGGADNYISGADGVITITNTKEESASVTMPATGGRGTRWYTITGAAILCGTAAGYLWFRRRYLSRVE